jgi:hypothetical protein
VTYPPDVTTTVSDGGLGLSASGSWYPLVVGYAEGATVNTLYQFQNGGPDVITTVGRGPGAHMAAAIAGGAQKTCLFLATAASTVASIGTVTKAALSTSTGTVAITGTPNASYKIRIRITTTGTVGVGRFQYAVDGYSNTEAEGWSPPIMIPAGGTYYLAGTGGTYGLLVTFTPSTGPIFFEAGDTFRGDTVAAHYTTADLEAAFAVLKAQLGTLKVRRVMFSGEAATATAAIVLAAYAGGLLDALLPFRHFARCIIDGGSKDTTANFKTAIVAFNHTRVGLVHCPGGARVTSVVPFTGCAAPTIPAVDVVAERWAKTELSESCARRASGSLRGVRSVGSDEWLDTRFTADDRIITLCSDPDMSGFFVTKPFIRSLPTSDFRTLQWGCVTDEVCQYSAAALAKWKEANLRCKTDGTGRLLSMEAAKIQADTTTALTNRLVNVETKDGEGHASGVSYTVRQDNDYLKTGEVYGSARVVPLREAEGITNTIHLATSI